MRADVPTVGATNAPQPRRGGGGTGGVDDGGSGDGDHDAGDHAVAAAVGATWDGVLRRAAAVTAYTSSMPDRPSSSFTHGHGGFTGGAPGAGRDAGAPRGVHATPHAAAAAAHLGPHERDMFLLIVEPVLSTLTAALLASRDRATLARIDAGLRDVAGLAAYFGSLGTLNTTVSLLCRLAMNDLDALVEAADDPAMLDDAAALAERFAGSLSGSGAARASGRFSRVPSLVGLSSAVSTGATAGAGNAFSSEDGFSDGENDGEWGGSGRVLRSASATQRPAHGSGASAAGVPSSPTGGSLLLRRSVLCLRSALSLSSRHAEGLRGSWGDVVALYTRLAAFDCVPHVGIDSDDFAAPNGMRLPSACDAPRPSNDSNPAPQARRRVGSAAAPLSPHFSRYRAHSGAEHRSGDSAGSHPLPAEDALSQLSRCLAGSTRLAAFVSAHQRQSQTQPDLKPAPGAMHQPYGEGGDDDASAPPPTLPPRLRALKLLASAGGVLSRTAQPNRGGDAAPPGGSSSGLWGSLTSLLVGSDDSGVDDDSEAREPIGVSGLTYSESLDILFTGVAAEASRCGALPALLQEAGRLSDTSLSWLVSALAQTRELGDLTPAGLLANAKAMHDATAAAGGDGRGDEDAVAIVASLAAGVEDTAVSVAVSTELLTAVALRNMHRAHTLGPALCDHVTAALRVLSAQTPAQGPTSGGDESSRGGGQLASILRRSQREEAVAAVGEPLVELAERACTYAAERMVVTLLRMAVRTVTVDAPALAAPPPHSAFLQPAHGWQRSPYAQQYLGAGSATTTSTPSSARGGAAGGATVSTPFPRAHSAADLPYAHARSRSGSMAHSPRGGEGLHLEPPLRLASSADAPRVSQLRLATRALAVVLDSLPVESQWFRAVAPRLASASSLLLRLGPSLTQTAPSQRSLSTSEAADTYDLSQAASFLSAVFDALTACAPHFLAAPAVWDALAYAVTLSPSSQLYAEAIAAAKGAGVLPAPSQVAATPAKMPAASNAALVALHPLVCDALTLHASLFRRTLSLLCAYVHPCARENGVAGTAAAVLLSEAESEASAAAAAAAGNEPPGTPKAGGKRGGRRDAFASAGLSRYRSPHKGSQAHAHPVTPPRGGVAGGAVVIRRDSEVAHNGLGNSKVGPSQGNRRSYLDSLAAMVLDEPLADLRAFCGHGALRLLEQLGASVAPGGRLLLAATELAQPANAPLCAIVDGCWSVLLEALSASLRTLHGPWTGVALQSPSLLFAPDQPQPPGEDRRSNLRVLSRFSTQQAAELLLRPAEPSELASLARASCHTAQSASASLTRLLLAPPSLSLDGPTSAPVVLFLSPGGTAGVGTERSAPPLAPGAWLTAFQTCLLPLLSHALGRLDPRASATGFSLETAESIVSVAGTTARSLLAASARLGSDPRFAQLWLTCLRVLLQLLASSAPAAGSVPTPRGPPQVGPRDAAAESEAARSVLHASCAESAKSVIIVLWSDGTLELATAACAAAVAAADAAASAAAKRSAFGSMMTAAFGGSPSSAGPSDSESSWAGGPGGAGMPVVAIDLKAATLQLVDEVFPPLRRALLHVTSPGAHAALLEAEAHVLSSQQSVAAGARGAQAGGAGGVTTGVAAQGSDASQSAAHPPATAQPGGGGGLLGSLLYSFLGGGSGGSGDASDA